MIASLGLERALFFGCAIALFTGVLFTSFIPLPVLLQMLWYTFPIIYMGSHMSLKQSEVDEVTGERSNKGESMDKHDAMLFPVFGSGALLGLYFSYKFLDPWWVNALLTSYLTTLGVAASAETATSCLSTIILSIKRDSRLCSEFSFNIKRWPFGTSENPLSIPTSFLHILCYVFSATLGGLWMYFKWWQVHNLFAISFCIQAIALVNIRDFKIATLLLSGLFIYDIFWVFGTDVMVTVAKNFEGPVKIIFPLQYSPWKQSILGLGDIVIPGIFLSMCLRFDNYMHQEDTRRQGDYHDKSKDERDALDKRMLCHIDIHEKFGKFYFWVVMISYELGLLTTGVVMLVFRHAQPALLYLVPYCLFSLFGAAALNGQVKEVLTYHEDDGVVASVEGADGKEESDKSETEKKTD